MNTTSEPQGPSRHSPSAHSPAPFGGQTLRHLSPDELVSELGIRRLLAVAAHPDDLDFGAAATMAALSSRGVEITLCLLTAGDAGGFSAEEDRETVPQRRAAEQREAAELLGLTQVIVLDERDGFVEPTHALIREIVRRIRQVRPDVVLTSHPERAWDRLQRSHPDHLACGEAVVRACYPAVENPFAYPELLSEEGLEAYRVPYLLLMAAPAERVNTWVSVAGYEGVKVEALRRHLSQHPDPDRMAEMVLGQMRDHADEASRRGIRPPDGTLEDAPAETFHLVTVNGEHTFAGF